jgi:hypothetical protein
VPAFLYLQANGYAIIVGLDATLSISDSCFINNNFVGDGIIIAEEMDDVSFSNTYGTADDELTCPFAMIDGDCVPFSSSSCTAKSGNVVDDSNTGNTTNGGSTNGTSTSGTSSVQLRLSIMVGILLVLAL